MRSRWTVTLLCVTAMHWSLAQNQYGRQITYKLPEGKHFFVIPPDSLWNEMPWKDSVYIFPEFGKGRIESKNGYSPTNTFFINYNLFFETFAIRQEDGGLTPFAYTKDIKYLWIDDHKFIYAKGLGPLQIIQYGRAAVAEATFMNSVVEYTSPGEYASLVDNRFVRDKRKRYYYKEYKYYIIKTSSGKVYRVGPNVLGKIFPKEKQTIKDFERTNKIDYNKKDDLMKIVLFCNREL